MWTQAAATRNAQRDLKDMERKLQDSKLKIVKDTPISGDEALTNAMLLMQRLNSSG